MTNKKFFKDPIETVKGIRDLVDFILNKNKSLKVFLYHQNCLYLHITNN